MSISWIHPARGRAVGSLTADYAFSVTHHAAGKNAPHQGCIRISVGTMKALRWIAGDRVVIGFSDDDKDIFIKRVQNGGFSLSPIGGKKMIGKTVACTVKSSRLAFKHTGAATQSDYVALDDGSVMFSVKVAA